MKSCYTEGTDLTALQLSYSYSLPKTLCKCLGVSDGLRIKEVSSWGVFIHIYLWPKLLTKNKSNYSSFLEKSHLSSEQFARFSFVYKE